MINLIINHHSQKYSNISRRLNYDKNALHIFDHKLYDSLIARSNSDLKRDRDSYAEQSRLASKSLPPKKNLKNSVVNFMKTLSIQNEDISRNSLRGESASMESVLNVRNNSKFKTIRAFSDMNYGILEKFNITFIDIHILILSYLVPEKMPDFFKICSKTTVNTLSKLFIIKS